MKPLDQKVKQSLRIKCDSVTVNTNGENLHMLYHSVCFFPFTVFFFFPFYKSGLTYCLLHALECGNTLSMQQ